MLTRGETFGVIESVKTASDLYSPVAGEVDGGERARSAGAPELINSDPYGDGWIVRVRLDRPVRGALLKDADAYRTLIGG